MLKNLCLHIQVAWELFSNQIAGAGNLPNFVDLLFLGTGPAPLLGDHIKYRRPATGTKVLKFTGKKGKL